MKFKKIPCEYFATILDRLTRFEPAYIRCKRVFDDIINKFLISESKSKLNLSDEIKIVEEIVNSSLKTTNEDFFINSVLSDLEQSYFIDSKESYQYLSSRLNLSQLIVEAKIEKNAPKNLLWLKKINDKKKDIIELRKKYKLLYPVEKIILCEGQTEFELLETIFNLKGICFDALGFLVIPAGGKNQVARKYYNMIEYTKIPFFILLDKDAASIKELIDAKLRPIDNIYLINSGEFEDLIPQKLLIKTINSIHKNEHNCSVLDFQSENSMVENLENVYRKYGFGEFKKAHFAHFLKEYIAQNCKKEDFEDSEISLIASNLCSQKPDQE